MLTTRLWSGAVPPFAPCALMTCAGQPYFCHDSGYSGVLLSVPFGWYRGNYPQIHKRMKYETDQLLTSGNEWNFTAILIPSLSHPVPYLGANQLLFILATKHVKNL